MFDRFKRNQPADEPAGTGRTAVAERPVGDDRTAVVDPAAERQRPPSGDAAVADDRTAVRDPEHDHHDGSGKAVAAGAAGLAAGEVAGRHHERKRERERAREEGAAGTVPATRGDTRARRHAPVLEAAALATMRDRQRARYGGISWGAAFFGWLSAVGLAAILTSVLVAAGAAIGLQQVKDAVNGSDKTIGLGGGILLLVVLAIAWYAGGYVAGRMARFDGARQGLAVWIWTLLFVALVALAAVIGGSQYDVAGRLNLPSIPTHDQTWTTGGAIAAAAALVVTLLFAVLGGKAGDLFHRRVDRIATDHYEEPAV
ncbi:MAG: hypothetical protein ACXVFN_05965 [Solirubrobacteraceae bacterium]